MIGLLIEAALSCKHDPHFVIVIIYHQDAVLIKAMKYAFLNFLYLQILQLWILIMLKLSLTLMNMKSGATQLSILILETAASKMRNRNVCKTRAHMMDHE